MKKLICCFLLLTVLTGFAWADALEDKYGLKGISKEEVANLWGVMGLEGAPPEVLDAAAVQKLISKIQWDNADEARGIGSSKAIRGGTLR
ncbi:MAG: hypothetical protein QGH40_03895, partial [bacterium]|nr:hypothetical protein [bacterium]